MKGDFSRWTFDPRAAYRSVLLQQGRALLDADWNEQTQITAHHDEVRTRDVVGRAGGPASGAAFGITDAAGQPPASAPWSDLRITPGRFYVEGVLVEVQPDPAGTGPALAAQPHLPGAPLPGLAEPSGNGRYAVVAEVREDHVTADEAPALREPALGGPDTTTRARTIWQLRLVKVPNGASCAQVHDAPWLHDARPTMTATLAEVPAEADPCRITTSSGYRRLENQLYRIEIHDVAAGGASYLWSRENGSVVARLLAIAATSLPDMDAELSLDAEGRDAELSIDPADVVEVTSAGRRLHGLPGFLARAGTPNGRTLPVAWLGDQPANLAALGDAPVVRRWEGPPRPADASKDALEDGIEVRFGAGDFRVGDHWLIPARTARMVYGQTALAGTIQWPADPGGTAAPQPPAGPVRRRAVVALLDRATSGGGGRWTLHADCRRLTPPLTHLVRLDLLGGDGQEALPGVALPEPVRVVVRNGGLPVPGARVRFHAAGGHLAEGAPTAASPPTLPVTTNAQGQAQVRWLLGADGTATKTLTARLLDDGNAEVGAEVRVTGRRSEAGQVGYDPTGCAELAKAQASTVQAAIDELCRRRPDVIPGIHVEAVTAEADGEKILNDSLVGVERLDQGVRVHFDEAVGEAWGRRPVLRLTVEVPWPSDEAEREAWGGALLGTQEIALRGQVSAAENTIAWHPAPQVAEFLRRLTLLGDRRQEPLLARLTVLGNAIASEDGERHLNGRAFGRLDGDRIDLELPTSDDVHGADFTTWFWIGRPKREQAGPRLEIGPHELVFTRGGQQLTVTLHNPGSTPLDLVVEAQTTSPPTRRVYAADVQRLRLEPGATQLVGVTASAATDQGLILAGRLVVTSADARLQPVEVLLRSQATSGVIPVREGALRLEPLREELVAVLTREEVVEVPKLRAELAGEPLRVAVAPGFEDAFADLRAKLAPSGVEVELVQGEPVELARRAAAGELGLDAVIGDAGFAGALVERRG